MNRFILTLFLFVSFHTVAEVKLPTVFGDHMVLQRETNVKFWGKANPQSEVRLSSSWNMVEYQTSSDEDGRWSINITTPEAGGSYEIVISDGEVLRLNDILIGEVWVCSGQSNMMMPMKGYFNQPVEGSNRAIATSEDTNLRIFTVEKNQSDQPAEDFVGTWQQSKPQSIAEFSATAYYFGKMLRETLGVPVGLIHSSWGGTKIEPWMSIESLEAFDWVKTIYKDLPEGSKRHPTKIYNAMISPIVGFGIRGVLWYQGESNRKEPVEYLQLLPAMVRDWRDKWSIGDFPFYYCQITPFDYKDGYGPLLREAQLKAQYKAPNMGMVSLMDVGEKNNIHPAKKQIVGERLAYRALAETYGIDGITYAAPELKEMAVEGSMMKLTFHHAENGLTSFGKSLQQFEIAGDNKRFFPAQAIITQKGITLSSPYVKNPVAVRYAFKDFVVGDLFNTAGLPASSFRTDDWKE